MRKKCIVLVILKSFSVVKIAAQVLEFTVQKCAA